MECPGTRKFREVPGILNAWQCLKFWPIEFSILDKKGNKNLNRNLAWSLKMDGAQSSDLRRVMKPPVETLKVLLLKITRVNLGQKFLVYVFQRRDIGELIFEQKIFRFFFQSLTDF